MIRDNDPSVVSNVLNCLDEILKKEGGMTINETIAFYLLNRITAFKSWGQCKVLEVVARYRPTNQEKLFDIMNLLDDRLRQSNSAVVLATSNVFLKLTSHLPKIHAQVNERVVEPLITLMSSPIPGVAYAVLSHIALLARRNPAGFSSKYKQFFCRFSDRREMKELKIKVLTSIANRSNATDIMNELAEYVTDHIDSIARLSVQCIADIAVRVASVAEEAMDHLISFLKLTSDAVKAETIVAVKNVMRKYPDVGNVLPVLRESMKETKEEEAKCATIFLLGAYGDQITDAHIFLKHLSTNLKNNPKK
eukprot:UN24398